MICVLIFLVTTVTEFTARFRGASRADCADAYGFFLWTSEILHACVGAAIVWFDSERDFRAGRIFTKALDESMHIADVCKIRGLRSWGAVDRIGDAQLIAVSAFGWRAIAVK